MTNRAARAQPLTMRERDRKAQKWRTIARGLERDILDYALPRPARAHLYTVHETLIAAATHLEELNDGKID